MAGMTSAEGILTARGGMTSHAAVVARGMGKCCVSGAGAINVDYKARTVEIDGLVLKEGDYISLNGSTGEVYAVHVFACTAVFPGLSFPSSPLFFLFFLFYLFFFLFQRSMMRSLQMRIGAQITFRCQAHQPVGRKLRFCHLVKALQQLFKIRHLIAAHIKSKCRKPFFLLCSELHQAVLRLGKRISSSLGFFPLLLQLLHLLHCLRQSLPDIFFRHASHVTVETRDDIPWSLDGEYAPSAPVVNIVNCHGAIELLVRRPEEDR